MSLIHAIARSRIETVKNSLYKSCNNIYHISSIWILEKKIIFKMTRQSDIKFTITLSDPDLDEEELEAATQNIVREFNELDAVEQASLVQVKEAPTGSKAVSGFVLGIVETIVDIGNIKGFMGFLRDRFSDKPIEIEVEANGRKLQLKASNQEDLMAAIRAAEDFITPD